MALEIRFGYENFANYKRLAYKWWFALAEFVDNSTQSFFDNRDILESAYTADGDRFSVIITTDRDWVRVRDNAMGMALSDLERAMVVGVPPENTAGRSRYGLGMKTAACWIGDKWKIVTTKLGESKEYTVEIDVPNVVSGNFSPPLHEREVPRTEHYTLIEIRDHHRPLRGRTIGKVKEYLQSIYRVDISTGDMLLFYNDLSLEWKGFSNEDFLKRKDGSPYRLDYIFEIDTAPKKTVEGWVGVLKKGARRKAGFSILHRKRLIKGWPDSWRPEKVFGYGGRNDLINQRVVGEVNLEDFEISHTKDDINWAGLEEEIVEEELLKVCKPYMATAQKYRKGQAADHGPTDLQVDSAVQTLQSELGTTEFLQALELVEVMPPLDQIRASNEQVARNAATVSPTFVVKLADTLTIRVYIDKIGSPNDPYFVYEDVDEHTLHIVVNRQHPHWRMIEGENAVVNYLRHCVYDGVSEHRATRMNRVESDTVKKVKDSYLRVAFEVLQNE